ncbi:phosphodiester glycosidase family protein [Flagellimonas algicola]|uniref:Phosphodiester glycosidase domain-containing protein n=1 Tax=Flagellimonas algicola TaxID=2583815 RepID=A0ABY2WG81_9FLAO|nr:phosphodiester glycosidase family protein [Allomuricauda algicola]TMU50430.1 hypothetical protein FGG15_19600 [Allomuricauda algicola]
MKKALIILLMFSCASDPMNFPDLDIGKMGLEQKVVVKNIQDGLDFIQVNRGHFSNSDFFTLTSGIVTPAKAEELSLKIENLGMVARLEYSPEPDPHGGKLGKIVRVGTFNTKEAAIKLREKLSCKGISMAIRHTAEDGYPTSGPFLISLLKIDLTKYKGQVKAILGNNQVSGKETTSKMSRNLRALAAVNAGFFAWENEVGMPGDPAGISVIDGKLLSEAIGGRSILLIENNLPALFSVAHNVNTDIQIELDSIKLRVHGINRSVGRILNCGNFDGSGYVIPIHDFVCRNKDEIVIFTPEYGNKGDIGEGLEIALDSTDRIISIKRQRGGEIPENGYLLQAIGLSATYLENVAKVEMTVTKHISITSDEGPILLKKGLYAVNGGPTLLRKGNHEIADRFKEGWETVFSDFKVSDEYVDKKDKAAFETTEIGSRAGFYHGWVVRRHPRTAIGITSDNKVYIAVVYGRQPGISAGASITEMSNLFKNLGVTEAFNLDGGGSSMMIVNGKKTGSSSDLSGERAIGDALIFTDY